MTSPFRFADLFAGIGGFHGALSAMGGECAYAVEIDARAAEVYRLNWGIDPTGDISRDANDQLMRVPDHDLLVAGFPCQPFSKSGAQRGMDEARGTLFWNIARIVEVRRPAVVVLENVRNLAGPRHRHELQVIWETLRELRYRVSERPTVFSPHLLPPSLGGRPQHRERVFITATRIDDDSHLDAEPVALPKPVSDWDPQLWDLEADLPLDPDQSVIGCGLSDSELLWLNAWDDFVQVMQRRLPRRRLPGFPIWVDAWTPASRLVVPEGIPGWKANFLRKNAEFYSAHRRALDSWVRRWQVLSEAFPPSRRKLEWQAQDEKSLWDCLIHLRPSGIRVKRATYLPSLVAITQTSIIGPRQRRLSPREAARVQGLPDSFTFGRQPAAATYRQLGNGVNLGVVQHVLIAHVRRDEEVLKKTAPELLAAVLRFADLREGNALVKPSARVGSTG